MSGAILHPWCRVCGWRKVGVDSWDGKACKCGLREAPLRTCGACAGKGVVAGCTTCDGSGLVPA